MKRQSLPIIALVVAYSLFMLWWFLREEAPSLRTKSTAATKKNAPAASASPPLGSSSKGGFPATGRAVAQASGQHIKPGEIAAFQPYRYPGTPPYYPGEPVTAYVRVPSTGKNEALTVNQGGEFPRMMTQPGETVQVRLSFTDTAPETPVALTAQDGGYIEGGLTSTAGKLDATKQLAFGFTVSKNPGIHRVTLKTPAGETKTLEFWAGPPISFKKP